jgi:hypothetical protein
MTSGHVFVREPVNQVPDLQYKTDFIYFEYRLQLPVLPLYHFFASMAMSSILNTFDQRNYSFIPLTNILILFYCFYYITLTQTYKTL